MAPSLTRSRGNALLALVVGALHAAAVLGVALRYGYDVGPSAYPPHMVLWRYGGLVALGALPVWLALEDRLLVPLALVAVLAALSFHAELTPPAPSFHDVSEFEPSIDGPTGYTVVENGLYLTKYASAWYAWTVGAALLGLWEHVVRVRREWLPTPARDVSLPTESNGALIVAGAAGLAHALASVAYGWGWGMHDDPLGVLWALVGGVLLLGVPVYLLLARRLVWPAAVAPVLFVNSVWAQQYGGPSDPHALYAIGWFFFLGISLAPGLIEYGLRLAGRRFDGVPS